MILLGIYHMIDTFIDLLLTYLILSYCASSHPPIV